MNKKKRNLLIAIVLAIILLIIAIVFVVNSKDDSANVSTNDVVIENDDANVSTNESEVLEDDANVSKDEVLEDDENSNDLSNDLEDSTNEEETLEDSTSESEDLQTTTPEVHEHMYSEVVVSEATCTNVGTKRFSCECGDTYDEYIDMLSHELGEFIYNNDATYEKDGTESASCKVCNNIIETRTKEGTMLVKEPEPVVVPSGLDTTIGSDIVFSDNSITSINGATLYKLASFNKAGLYNAPSDYVSKFDWCGYIVDDVNTPQGQASSHFGANMARIEEVVGCDQGYTIWNDTIYFYFLTGGSAGDLELRRHPSNGFYTIAINYDISSGYGDKITKEDGRDALLGFCTMISSTPSELENIIYNDCFVDTSLLSYDYYTTIGDCQVKNYYGVENQTMVYAIKPK